MRVRISRKGRMPSIPSGIDLALIAVLDKEAERVKTQYEKTTRTWQTDVEFTVKVRGKQSREVSTKSKIYGYVDVGTRPHVIRVRKAKTLAFNTVGFKPKTVPRVIGSRAGKAAQPPTAFPLSVNHPGNEGREFTILIQQESKLRLKKEVDKVFAKFKKKGGK